MSGFDSERACPGCFNAPLVRLGACGKCGFDPKETGTPNSLPPLTELAGRYLIGRTLGRRGGSGIVYLGWDRLFGVRVAVKEYFPRDLALRSRDGRKVIPEEKRLRKEWQKSLRGFFEEARTLTRLNHENVVSIQDVLEDYGTAYLVMDYLEGLSLEQYLLEKGGRLELAEAALLMGGVLRGLAHVHSQGYLHRDVKPANLYLTPQVDGGWRPLLLDFGAARQLQNERTMTMVLSRPYAPPEQWERKGRQDERSDLYATCAMFYELLMGVEPPSAPDRLRWDPLQDAAAWPVAIDKNLIRVLCQGMALNPAARPATIPVLMEMLRNLGLELGEESTSATGEKCESDQPVRADFCESAFELPESSARDEATEAPVVEKFSHGERRICIAPDGAEIALRWIPAGSFTMGSDLAESGRSTNEATHRVVLSHGFWMGETAVTQAQFQALMGKHSSGFLGPELPVEQVSWLKAEEYCQLLSACIAEQGWEIRLPREAEWEYACRAGTETAFYCGDFLDPSLANFDGNYPYGSGSRGVNRKKTVPVRSFGCNAWGLYEMHGNVWEWCQDWFGPYDEESVQDPKGPSEGTTRVVRGGGWYNIGKNCRSACRASFRPDYYSNSIGFRILLAPLSADLLS